MNFCQRTTCVCSLFEKGRGNKGGNTGSPKSDRPEVFPARLSFFSPESPAWSSRLISRLLEEASRHLSSPISSACSCIDNIPTQIPHHAFSYQHVLIQAPLSAWNALLSLFGLSHSSSVFKTPFWSLPSSLVAQMVNNLPAMQETWVRSLEKISGEGNSYPIQYSCLENSMNRGAWWATVHRVTKTLHDWATNTFTFVSSSLSPSQAWPLTL